MEIVGRPGWMTALLAIVLSGLSLAAIARDAAPVPDPGAPEGAVAVAHTDRPFDRYALPVGSYTAGAASSRSVEGRVIWSSFRLDAPETSTAEVMSGYRARLSELGFRPIFDCVTAACGGFEFRFAVQLLPAPAMQVDTADFAQYSASRDAGPGVDGGSETFVSVLVSRLLGAVYVQTVVVVPSEPGLTVAPVLEAAAAAAAPVIPGQDEKSLLDQLTEFGHVPVQGLVFETGGAALSDSSAPALDILARLVSNNPELDVVIVGHSDNQGSLEINIALSKRRAEAVRDALIARGVAAARLEAHGAGYLAPVASNATDAGRSLNRRVELVVR